MERIFTLNPLSAAQRTQLADRENQRSHVRLGDWGHDLLPLLTELPHQQSVSVVTLNIGDLGLPKEAIWLDTWRTALERGLGLLHPSMILPLRFDYDDQPADDFVRLAHDDIMLNGQPHRFALYNPGTALLALGRESGGNTAVWPRVCRFAFLRTCL
jgi:hypothetical protein